MKLRRSILACGILCSLIFAFLVFPVFAQISPSAQTKPPDLTKSIDQTTTQSGDVTSKGISEELKPGIVVEKIEKNSEGERAGLREGDVLLNWNRGDAKGVLESPFDLLAIEIEQAPRGPVALVGYRDAEKRIWTLGQNDWYVKTRPAFSGDLLYMYRRGEELVQAGQPVAAAEHWREVAIDSRKSLPRWLSIWFLSHSAEVLTDARKWKEADGAYKEAIQAAVGKEPPIAAQLFQSWADTYAQRGNLEKREQYQRQALTIRENSVPESLTLAASLFHVGDYEANRRVNLAKAEEFYRRALAIQKKLAPYSRSFAQGLESLAWFTHQRGDIAAAEKYSLQAKAIEDEIGVNEISTLVHLAAFSLERGDLVAAEGYASKTMAIAQELPPPKNGLWVSIFDLGLIALDRGDLARASEYYRRDLAVQQELYPDLPVSPNILTNLGHIAQARGDLAKAKAYYLQALPLIQKRSPHSILHAMILASLGSVAEEEGYPVKAEEYCHRAQAILSGLGSKSIYEAAVLNELGIAAWKRRDLVGAEQSFVKALQIEKKQAPDGVLVPECLNHLGDVFRDGGDLAKAEEYYSRALAIRKKMAPGSTDHAESLASLAGVMRRKQRPEDAATLYEQALNALETQTTHLGGGEELRSGFRAKYASYYKDDIDLLLEQKKPEQAFHVLERLRGRSLLEKLLEVHADIRRGVDPALAERELSLQESLNAKLEHRIHLLSENYTDEQLASFDKKIDELLAQHKDLEEQIRTSSPSYAALTQPQPLSAKEIQQQLLDTNTLLLEYSLGEERSYVFAVTPDSLNAYELPKRTEIEKVARHAYELLTEHNGKTKNATKRLRQAHLAETEAEYSRTIAELSRMILGPVASQLQQKRLLIVSDGALQYIPFAVLPTPGTASNQSVPLVAEHEIVNLPSASVLAMLRREELERKATTKTVAVLADPVFAPKDDRVSLASSNSQPNNGHSTKAHPSDPQALSAPLEQSDLDRSAQQMGINGFPRLPFTRREADAISSIAPAGDVTEHLDFDASKATALSAQLKDYRIVHFATHGLLNNEHPELSGLVFSLVDKNGNEQDGFLRMLDIYNMELNADLVVLSACQTALGKEIGEEGLVGLTRGFMYAGAPRVVASLWKVDDEATAELMKKFYEGMLRDHQTPAQALRSAQQWMRTQKAWQSPYYWAGFVLQGEWK
jgi:CHAT domain-containing protein/tetratricopeptide (TPR) repeat protein